jgi:hypothetical protein
LSPIVLRTAISWLCSFRASYDERFRVSDKFGVEALVRGGDFAEWWLPLTGADTSALGTADASSSGIFRCTH